MRARLFQIAVSIGILGLFAALTAYLVAFAPITLDYDEPRPVLIPIGSDVDTVADSLESAGILKRRTSFLAFAGITGWGDQVKAGHYLIESGVSSRTMLDKLRRGLEEPIRVRIPAGSRKERVARGMASNMAFSAADLLAVLRDSTFAAEVGTDTTRLFGYLLPDTYFFYWLTEPRDVVRKVKETVDALMLENQRRLNALSPPLSVDDVLSMAAIVEWESSIVEEKGTIAGVYLNRLRDGWRLQADPTVQYAVMLEEGEKRRLLYRDYEIQHPFNTYRIRGLPPGPITNPSRSSIEAVLNPDEHNYFYFVATGDGGHIFSRTLSEHNRAAADYRRRMRERRAEEAAEAAATAATDS